MNTTTPTVTVRLGRATDLPAVGDLWAELIDFHITRDRRFLTARNARESFVRHLSGTILRSPDHAVFVAEVDGRIAGFLVAKVEYGGPIFLNPNFGYITDACVDEAFRRQGIGHHLFGAAKSWFRARGLTNIRVSVATENPVACSFWRDLGFRPFMERLWYDLDG